MKRLLAAGLLLVMSCASALAASQGYQQAASLSTSSAINLPSIPQSAGSAVIYVEGSSIRWRDDGTDPTSAVGNPVNAGQAFCYANDSHGIRIIGQTAGATINVTYYAGTCR